MYVILTSKPGEFRTEVVEGLQPIESWDYACFGRRRARFVIARLWAATKVRIVDETPPQVVNLVPTKFLAQFETLEGARRELQTLAPSSGQDFVLTRA